MQPSASASVRSYEERLTAPRSWWFAAVVVGIACGLAVLPFGTPALLGGIVAGTAATAVVVSAYGSVRIRVVGGQLVAGDARIPLSALGEVHLMDAEEAGAWRTYKADPRAFMLLRGYVRTAVRVEVTDPDDPTPYLYLSTRHPQQLAEALGGDVEG